MRCHKFRIPCLTKHSRGWRTVICSDSESSERWKKGRRSNHGLFWGAKWTCCIVCIVAKYLWSKGNPPCADVLQPVFNCVLDSFALTLPKHPKQTGDAGRLFIGFYWWLSSSLCIWDKLGFQLRSCLTWQLVASKQCKLSAPSAQQIQQHESLGNWWKLMERQYECRWMSPIKRIQEEFQVYIWSCPCASLPFCITAWHSGHCPPLHYILICFEFVCKAV